MLIKRLEVKGFKSLKDVVWEPGPLTILIGPNGSGKTNLLKALDLISSSSMEQLEDEFQRGGGVLSLYWDGREKDISFQAIIDLGQYKLHKISTYALYEFTIHQSIANNSYDVTNENFILVNNTYTPVLSIMHRDTDTVHINIKTNTYQYAIKKPFFSNKETILSKSFHAPDESHELEALEDLLTSLFIYQQIDTSNDSNIRRPKVTRLDRYVDSDAVNLVNVLHTLYSENRDFENDINTAMRAAFGDVFDRLVFPPAADQLIQLRIRWKSLKCEQSMLDLSDGTIRFLFLMTVLCNPDPPPLIAIDEPEIGLHPSMFPIIAEYAAEASKRTQVIFSTHSPQFLDAFSNYDVTTTVTSWKDGETKIKNLDGQALKDWLEHYSLGTLFLSGDLEALA